jgi:hypothetical protein
LMMCGGRWRLSCIRTQLRQVELKGSEGVRVG